MSIIYSLFLRFPYGYWFINIRDIYVWFCASDYEYFDSGKFEPEAWRGFYDALPTIITSYDEYRDDRPVGHLRRSKVLRRQTRVRREGGREG